MPVRLNLLQIITELELGGAQKNVLHIAALLDKDRYELSLLSSNKGILAADALNIPKVNAAFLPALRRPISPLRDLLTLIQLTRFIKNNKFDLVHTHSSKAGILGRWAARFAAAPVILHTVHGWGFNQRQNPLTRGFFAFLERITARVTDKLIAVSEGDIRTGLDAGIAAPDKYALIRYGIPVEEFSGCRDGIKKKKEELGLNADSPVVGMVACFKPQKAPRDFLKIAALVKKDFPETKFLMVGDGILRRKSEGLRDRLGLKEDVFFTGWRRDIPRILPVLDVFVLTSLWEGLPVVILEAMACALPVVATSTEGARELIRPGINGFLAPLGDVRAMAQKIGVLLKDKALSHKMGQEGRRLLTAGFRVENMVQEIGRLYQDLARKKGLC